ncbi:hypothetical protein ACXHXG_20240 [Rhizobium sp. LEGMi198b]
MFRSLAVVGSLALSDAAFLAFYNFSQTTHQTVTFSNNKPISSSAMEALIDNPGQIRIETVVGADWKADLSGLVNQNNPRMIQRGHKDREMGAI